MQTFLPYPDFIKSAQCLDDKRLGKQRVECLQILKALTIPDYGWKNHPIIKMWKGYEIELSLYGITICGEWMKRGYKDTTLQKIYKIGKDEWMKYAIDYMNIHGAVPNIDFLKRPIWFGNESFHLSHQSNLLRKDYAHYSKFFIDVPDDLPYQWYDINANKFYTT